MKQLKILILCFALLPILCIAQNNQIKLSKTPVKERDSLIKEYERIIMGLKLNYVVEYRQCFGSSAVKDISELEFYKDSLKYWKSYNEFFVQDVRIVDWLLTYYDANEPKKIRVCELYDPIWREFLCVRDLNISECEFFFFDSRPAIVLILNYFEGQGFTCFECSGQKRCERNQYRTIKSFLKKNRERELSEIRTEWKKVELPCLKKS